MKSVEEFQRYFDEVMRPKLEPLEAERQRNLPRVWRHMRWWLLAWVAVIVALFVLGAMGPEMQDAQQMLAAANMALFIVGVIVVPLWRWIQYSMRGNKMTKRVKQEVIIPMLEWLVPDLTYRVDGKVAEASIAESGIFNAFKFADGEDHFAGRIGETDVEFSEIGLHYDAEVTRNNQTRIEERVNRGLFLIADFNKDFTGTMLLYPDFFEANLGGTASKWVSLALDTMRELNRDRRETHLFHNKLTAGLKLIHLEDPEFEKAFEVLCSDELQAHYILSPSLMARLTAFHKKLGQIVYLSFRGSKVHLYLPSRSPDGLFEVGLYDDLLNIDEFRAIYDDVAVAFGIVEDLNLNTRIWSKGTAEA